MDILKELHFANRVWILVLPCVCMAFDVMTGLIYAWISKTFDSARMRAGLGKKVAELSYIILGCVAAYALGIPLYVVVAISLYIVFMELMSIMENCDKLGAPMPKFVKDVVNNVNDTINNGDVETIQHKVEEFHK